MRCFLSILFNAVFAMLCCAQDPAIERKQIADAVVSVPVKKGFILSSHLGRYGKMGCPPRLVGIYTPNDSAFSLDEVTITAVFKIDSFYCVVTKNDFGEFISYSNLSSTPYKKGDRLHRGCYLGGIGKSDDENGTNQLDIIVSVPGSVNKTGKRRTSPCGISTASYSYKELSHDECIQYILKKRENACSSNSATLL